jgi:hypothetical protein
MYLGRTEFEAGRFFFRVKDIRGGFFEDSEGAAEGFVVVLHDCD